jgi:type IV pilus assembly protein PilO
MAVDFKDFQKLRWYYQVLTVAAVCGGLLGLVWYQFLAPMEAEIVVRTGKLAELQGQIHKSIQQQRVFEQFKRETAELELELESLKSVLPLEKETDQLLRQAQQSASASGLRILRLGPRPIIDHEVYTEWPIDMEVVGTYHNIGAFLDRIRKLPRIVNINNLQVQSRASEGDAGFGSTVGATYTATTFVYREEQIPEDAPAAPAR